MPRPHALPVALAALVVASALAVGPAAGAPPDSASRAPACAPGLAAADNNPATDGNVSLTTLVAPGAAFDRLRNASAIAAARERGLLVPADAGEAPEADGGSFVARNDTVVHRLDLDGPAAALFDRLDAQPAATPTGNFTALLRADDGVSMRYVGPYMCPPTLNVSASAARGAFRVVPDEDDGALYLVLDVSGLVMDPFDGGSPVVGEYDHGHHAVGVRLARASGLVAANRSVRADYEVVDREVALSAGQPGLVRFDPAERPVLSGRTTVAPGTNLTLRLRRFDGDGAATMGTAVNRRRAFGLPLPVRDVPGSLYVLTVPTADLPPTLVAAGNASGAFLRVADPEPRDAQLPVVLTTTHGGFVVVRDAAGAVLGQSEYLEPGVANPSLDLAAALGGAKGATVVAYRDANGNREFDPGADRPYPTAGAIDRAAPNLTLGGRLPAAADEPATTAPPSTSTARTTTRRTAGTTTTPTATSATGAGTPGTTTTAGQPGFGVALAALAVLAVALARRRSR